MITDTRIRIFSYIVKHGRVRVHDLATAFHLSNVAIHKQLRKLVEDGKIKKIGRPPVVFYVQTKASTPIQEIKEKVAPILKKAHVKKAALFGSYVRGDNTEDSDIDILVELPKEATLIDLISIKQDLEAELQKEVDVITYNGIDPLLKNSILQSQYPIL